MVIKINYTSSDIYVSTNVSPVYVVVNYSAVNNGSGAVWGGITGTLSDQTDLQNALNAKVPYSGAIAAVNLGAYDLTVNELTIGKGLNGVANNTALGKRTLFHNTTGNYNTAVGHEAGHNLTTGQYNTAIGQSAMFTATTAGQNTAIGVNALLLTTSGGSNVAVGVDTLQHITTGSSNTAIGYNAGSHITGGSTPNTTATNSVFIGRDSKAAADGQTNQIVIGQNAVGNGSNTATFGNTATTANYFTGSVNGGSFVKSGGTSSQFLKADGSVDSSSYVGGSGATGQVAYWNGTNSQTGSNNLFWDAANARLGIGLTNPSYGLDVSSSVRFSNATAMSTGYSFGVQRLQFNNGVAGGNIGVIRASTNGIIILNNAAESDFNRLCFGAASTSFPALQRSGVALCVVDGAGGTLGNLLVGGTSDGGQRLQVYGDAFIKGSGNTSATIALRVENSGGFLLMRVLNDGRLRFGNSPFMYPFSTVGTDVNIGGTNLSFNSTTTTQSTINGRYYFGGDPLTQTSAAQYSIYSDTRFFPTSGTATFSDTYITTTINQTGGANGITRGLYVNPTLTAAADWRSIEWSNNSGWGLYGAGTANNYLGGRLGIGNTNPTNILDILANANNAQYVSIKNSSTGVDASAGYIATNNNNINGGFLVYSSTFANSLYTNNLGIGHNKSIVISTDTNVASGGTSKISFVNGGYSVTPQMTLTAAGRLLLGTTTEGTFLLDVNGTARVSGATTLGSTSSVAAFIPSGTALRVNQNNGTLYIDAGLDLAGTIIIRGTTLNLPSTSASSFSSNNVDAGVVAAGTGLKIAGQQVFNVKSSGDVLRFNDNTTYTNVGMYGNGYQISNSTIPINMTFNASALFELNTTTKGFLPPRMTTTQKNAIATPAAGLIVYDTDTNKLCCYNGTSWNDLF